MQKKTIIFDFDGTLVDSLEVAIHIFNTYAPEYGLSQITKQDLQILRGKGYREVIKYFNIPFYKIPFYIKKFRNEFEKEADRFKLFPGIKKTLETIKENGYTTGILTSNTKVNVEKVLKNNDANIFDFIHAEKNLFGKKYALKNLIKKYNLNKNEVVYIGDEVRDIEACKAVGIDIIAVTYGFNTKEILAKNHPAYLIDKPEDILAVI